MKKITNLRWLIMSLLLAVGASAWGDEVTYLVNSKNTLRIVGTAPTGSSASLEETYGTSQQMTKDNSQTLTLSGYNGCTISNISLEMHSNKSSGAGKLSYSTDGGTTFTYIVGSSSSGSAFNSTNWNGAWSQDWVTISKDVNITASSSNLIIKIEATTNSLFCKSYTITYSSGSTPTVSTPSFTPAAGIVSAGTEVTIGCLTTGATIHYTTDGSTPTSNSTTYVSALTINSTTTIKAIATKDGYNNSDVASATYTIETNISGYTIDFESSPSRYTDWIFDNIGNTNTSITAHSGAKYGSNLNENGNGVSTASITTKEKVARPGTFTCFVSKTSTNTTASSWKIQVSSDGSSWTDVATQNAISMNKGEWIEFSANLSSYTNVYVRLYYGSSNAIRAVDDIVLTESTSTDPVNPTFAWSAATATAIVGETPTLPTLSNNSDGTVSYSSSDTDVATIDNNGNVTILAAGETTITASVSATSNYNAATATYTLTVNEAAPANQLVFVDSSTGDITFYFNNTGWGLPTSKQVEEGSYTNSGYTIKVAGSTGNGFYYADTQQGKYLLMGKSGAYLTLPAFDFDVERIEITGTSGASESVVQNIFVGDDDVSTATTGAKNVTNNYDIDADYQAAGNVYTLKVTSAHNTQFTQIKVYRKSNNPSLSFTNQSVAMHVGETAIQTANSYNIGNNTVSYATGDQNIATVNASTGEVTSVASGETTITASVTVDGTTYTASYTVVVSKNDAGISYSQTSFQIEQGSTFTAPTLNNPNNLTVTYSGDNDAVATVDPTTGAVTLVGGTGTVTITATSAATTAYNEGTASYTLRVRSEETGGSGNYEKITSIDDLKDGDYLIVYEGTPVAFNGGLTTLDAASNNISVTITDDMVESNATVDAAIFTIEALTGGGYSIKSASGYYIGSTNASGGSNELRSSTSTVYTNSISFDNDGNAVITGTHHQLCYNSASNDLRFRYYKDSSANGLRSIALYKRTQGAVTVKTPLISPETGTYTTRPQTITITCATEGATIYYTLDGTNPTNSSTQYTGSFTINSNKTIKAIAYLGSETSRVAEETISFTVNPPVFSETDGSSFDSAYDIEITADPGLTIFFITQDNKIYKTATGMTATKSEASVDANGNPILVSTAQNYSGALTFSQSIMITAVAIDADGVQSNPVTVQYTHTGAVSTPYYSQFSASAGDFTITNVASGSEAAPEWHMNSNTGPTAIANWGEERYYMMVQGTSGNTNETRTRYYGTAYLTSPIIDLTDKTDASFSFIHAGHHFYADPNTSSTGTNSGLEKRLSDAKAKEACRVEVGISDASGNVATWTDISDNVNYFTQKFNTNRVDTESGSNDQVVSSSYTGTSRSGNFPRANSGDISLASYAGNYIRIRFKYTSTSSNYGTWNVDKVTVNASKTEIVQMNSKGWTTYVFDHDIDAYQTTKNYEDSGKTLKIYKVTEFDKTEVVLQQLGMNTTGADNSERYLHSKTPVVIEGPANENIAYVVYNPASELPLVKNNLLYASMNPNLVTATEDTRYYVLQWRTTTEAPDGEPYFNRMKTGKQVPDHKAYLNGVDEIDQVSTKTNSVKGIYVLGGESEDVATGIAEVDNAQDTLKNGVIYNLAGQRVVNPTKGLYIVNGKKVYLK